MTAFSSEDRTTLERANAVRDCAIALVTQIQERLPMVLSTTSGLRVSKVREDSDRVGVFFFLPKAGNSWCGVVLKGSATLSFRFEARGDSLTVTSAAQAGLVRDGNQFAAELSLVDETDPLQSALTALKEWTSTL